MYVYSKFARPLFGIAAIAMLLLSATLARAVDFLDGDLQLHGFFSLTLVNTSNNNFFGPSDDQISNEFSEVGVNASWRLTPDVQLSGQLLSHRAGGTDDGQVRLDYGLLDWTTASSEDGRSGVRVGRIKTAYGLYNKTRDVPFTRPSIILPQSIYFERTRNLTVSADGAEIYLERYDEAGSLSASFALGQPQTNSESATVALVGVNPPGHLDAKLAPDFQVLYEGQGGKYRLGFTALHVDLRYKPGYADRLGAGRFRLTPLIFSAQYNAENWSLTGEYASRRISVKDFGPFFYNGDALGESYYLQATYRLAPKWEALLRYDVYYADKGDRNGEDFAAATRMPGFTRYAKDWTAGVRFDVTPQFMLRAEVHQVDGTGFLAVQDNPNPQDLHRYWDSFMLLGSFRF
ncbi:MAG: hypothetical protein AW11_02034 [Candidatus Accumulibacter regalis]|jgi:hypothetical protein|uniref:Uncharacterized protein n=1 Tax=Accumulibacter regalis TaxID=522306 RepID=A0A011RB56_ACCRE|nr:MULTISPECIES: hypothetical protein [unclassified Candidatus Accumulibacter]EXI88414.1 MAG: hypothetical protein AW11_02034 [Candidatus Accumulibacter regalis]MBL8367798.1 hypothetical protein [Accumulibacter sp.]MBN8513079.1 hypothetical protein [Accumulibacter sp.]MBO3701730.1 hypothetical protein [Accumulibacter sp.]HRE71087.1 hypothetical protein [Accumulibacter sp.]